MRRKTGATWTEERREKHKAIMREIWRGKEKGRKEAVETNVVHSGLMKKKNWYGNLNILFTFLQKKIFTLVNSKK